MTARDQSRELKPDYDGLVARLREFACDGHAPVELAIWLHEQLVHIQGDGFSVFTYVVCLMKAFGLDVGTAQQFLRWIGFGWGGSLTDSELNGLLTPAIEQSVARIRQDR
jgi:hypothetical protein